MEALIGNSNSKYDKNNYSVKGQFTKIRRLKTITNGLCTNFTKSKNAFYTSLLFLQSVLNTKQSYGDNNQRQRYKSFFSVPSSKPLNWSEPKYSTSYVHWPMTQRLDHMWQSVLNMDMQMDGYKIGSVWLNYFHFFIVYINSYNIMTDEYQC